MCGVCPSGTAWCQLERVHCFSISTPFCESTELSYSQICSFLKVVIFYILMNCLAFPLVYTPTSSLKTEMRPGRSINAEQVGLVSLGWWLEWVTQSMMKTKKKLECSTDAWSQVLSQGIKPKSRCLGNVNRCINKTMGTKHVRTDFEAIQSIHCPKWPLNCGHGRQCNGKKS